ncbi:MAG: hypothetical protein A2Y84_00645 [Candidatus Colwellbacteria bacterium RBG_13_48_8]|uniref:dTDP-4-dehydrorhamnose reductase n=1 Tax=Candidatus Colwellbacteria bacterium RBG_13_48_8 TaxID=1797685 RepID=A0A1G1YX91_9BACT|nr:MAG: hypothetical protein A2Y84_00645 [Candidatus Colwellbacteria bacterium RBG_13_48_8]
MSRVVILGATGMLGSTVYDVLKDRHELVLVVRDKRKLALLDKAYGKVDKHKSIEFDAEKVHEDFLANNGYSRNYLSSFLEQLGEFDYAINAIGIINRSSAENEALTLFINGALPHILAREWGYKLIHISTDCAFNGIEGAPYDEDAPKTPSDLYGLSKSIGEPTNCLTIRTSIIGRELEGFKSLLEWFLHQEGQELRGFSNHLWNGITAKQFGRICDQIIQNPGLYPRTGIYHVFSDVVSKYGMLLGFKNKFNVDCTILEDSEPKLNRTLATKKELNSKLNIPSFSEMLSDL